MEPSTWHRLRQKGIGSSDAAAVLGLSNYKTPYDIFLEKTSPTPVVIDDTPKMKAGRMLEGVIADWWGEEFKIKVQRDNKFRFHEDATLVFSDPDDTWTLERVENGPPMYAELDRLAFSPERGWGLVEIKNTERRIFEKWRIGEMPIHFFVQTQHQFACSRLKWGALVCLLDGWDLQSIDLMPDPAFIEDLVKSETRFWNEHVLAGVAPDPIRNSDLEKLFPSHEDGRIVEVSPIMFEKVKAYAEAHKDETAAKARKETLKFEICREMGTAEKATFKNLTVCSYRKNADGEKLNTDRLFAEAPDIYARFMEPTQGSRVFRLSATGVDLAAKKVIEELKMNSDQEVIVNESNSESSESPDQAGTEPSAATG